MKDKFTLRDLIYGVSLIIGIISAFLVNRNEVGNLKADVIEIKAELKANNLELLNYKLDALTKKQDEMSAAINSFINEYRSEK